MKNSNTQHNMAKGNLVVLTSYQKGRRPVFINLDATKSYAPELGQPIMYLGQKTIDSGLKHLFLCGTIVYFCSSAMLSGSTFEVIKNQKDNSVENQ